VISFGVGYEVHIHFNKGGHLFSGQTIFSFTHIKGIILGTGEEVDEIAGGATGMGVDRIE
jgi:hypothetical protein